MTPGLRAAVLLLAAFPLLAREPAVRVLLVSMDGFGYRILTQEDFSLRMPTVRNYLKGGVMLPMQPAFPSTTANGHVALATGAWGNTNGVPANAHPPLPRSEHSSFERISGFQTQGLRAETIWEAAARQGLRAGAVNFVATAPQLRPGVAPMPGLLAVNHYQSRQVAPHRILTAQDVTWYRCGSGQCFRWEEAGIRFEGQLRGRGMEIRAEGRKIRVAAAGIEREPPGDRSLARYFSPGLRLTAPVDAVVYFRLFSLSQDQREFELLRSSIAELAISDGNGNGAATRDRILREAGGVVSNPWSALHNSSKSADLERAREVSELAIRQQGCLIEWMWRVRQPRLLAGYFSEPDASLHAWYGLARTNPIYRESLEWVFRALDNAMKPILAQVGRRDHFLLVSDHGMTPTERDAGIYAPLERAGLVSRTSKGDLDHEHSRVSYLYNCLVVNTSDWKGGNVPPGQRLEVVDAARAALRAWRDPENGRQILNGFYTPEADSERLGLGGEAGGDLCFDPAEGYYLTAGFAPEIKVLDWPRANHGVYPLREEMRSILGGQGQRLKNSTGWAALRAIDVAPLAASLLGMEPPCEATGRSPLAANLREPALRTGSCESRPGRRSQTARPLLPNSGGPVRGPRQ